MARARNIKPSFFKNELLGEADPLLGLLFISLWTLADKSGRLEDRPLRIKAETFPYREGIDINGYLTQLLSLGFIDRYKAVCCGKEISVIEIVNFTKHQTPHSTEKPSELPQKPASEPITLINESAAVNGHINVLIPDSLLLIPDSLGEQSNVSENCNSEEIGKLEPRPSTSNYGLVAKALVSAGMHTLNQSNPTFIALVDAGATPQEFVDAYIEQKSQNKKSDFNYILAKVSGRREDAAKLILHQGALPKKSDREAGRQIAALSIFTPENTQHLQGVELKTINEINYEQPAITA